MVRCLVRGVAIVLLSPICAVMASPVDVRDADIEVSKPALIGKRIGEQALAAQRGGTDVSNDAALQAVVSNNRAVNVTTGSNLITGGALAGAAGIPVVVQNSGNNVVVQSSTIINLQLK